MRRFQFRLERLLELKAYREQEWQNKLAEIMGICIRLARQIKEIVCEADRSFKQRFRGQRAEELDLNLLEYRELYLIRLEKERMKLEGELQEKLCKKEEIQQKFLEASRERKVLDKLKERKQIEYYAKQRLEEFKLLDETNSSQIAREKLRGI